MFLWRYYRKKSPYSTIVSMIQYGDGRSEVTRTPGILLPKQARYQLRYTPVCGFGTDVCVPARRIRRLHEESKLKYYMTQCARSQAKPLTNRAACRTINPCLIVPIIYKKRCVTMENSAKTMDQIVALCKNRGFVYPGSEIYGGLANSWDYGPLGVEFKNNVKKA